LHAELAIGFKLASTRENLGLGIHQNVFCLIFLFVVYLIWKALAEETKTLDKVLSLSLYLASIAHLSERIVQIVAKYADPVSCPMCFSLVCGLFALWLGLWVDLVQSCVGIGWNDKST